MRHSLLQQIHALPESEFLVRNQVQRAVEISGERAAVHHVEILAVDPVFLFAEFLLHSLKELCSGKRVRYGNTNFVGFAFFHHRQSTLDVTPGLSRVAVLEEEPDTDAMLVELPGRAMDLLDRCALLHCVEYFLRTGFRSDPGGLTSGTRKMLNGIVLQQEIGAREALERNLRLIPDN